MNYQKEKSSLWLWAVPAAIVLSTPLLNTHVVQAQDAASTTATATTEVAPANEEFTQGVLFPYPLISRALEGKMDKNGNINYLELQKDKNLATFIRALSTADLTQFPVHTVKIEDAKPNAPQTREDRSAELAFWINAYNAHILKAVSDAYPIKSPSEIKDLDIAKTRIIAGKPYSLKELREKIVKLDKRAYFALTSATSGGPLLPATGVYWYADLDARLNDAVSAFVRSNRNVELNTIQKYATISDYFKGADPLFKQGAGRERWSGIRNILAAYSDGYNRKFFTAQHYEIRFIPAQNSLNEYTETSPTS